jgi:NAD(P)-dependent dehydrogenase (short-subunit alcohol dehydrogenase family)
MTKRQALVTGAMGGIGSAVCDRLRADGVAVGTLDRFGSPGEVADLVAFLAGDSAGYITAQGIGIDGGPELNTLFVGPT